MQTQDYGHFSLERDQKREQVKPTIHVYYSLTLLLRRNYIRSACRPGNFPGSSNCGRPGPVTPATHNGNLFKKMSPSSGIPGLLLILDFIVDCILPNVSWQAHVL